MLSERVWPARLPPRRFATASPRIQAERGTHPHRAICGPRSDGMLASCAPMHRSTKNARVAHGRGRSDEGHGRDRARHLRRRRRPRDNWSPPGTRLWSSPVASGPRFRLIGCRFSRRRPASPLAGGISEDHGREDARRPHLGYQLSSQALLLRIEFSSCTNRLSI
jgi:hypothetical protein